jgi:hypothetical protein
MRGWMHTRLALGLLAVVIQLVPSVGWAQVGILPVRSPGRNAAGWNNTDVTVQFTCYTTRSGVTTTSQPITLTDEGADQSVTGRCSGVTGGAMSITEGPINIDKTPPVVTYAGNLGTYTPDQTVNITCTATDDLSGVESTTCADITGPAASFAPGLNTFSATATDKAGNTGTGSTSFVVQVN